ncbi:MAG: cytochrome c biogenesis protein ResB, partial [Thiovulaceae bacterium]|nr:cytochrome c biogenesis protein ResB [Sulfurimonadaceae bacterium]
MKNPFLKKILSMKAMAISMLAFALSIAVATFIENDYDTNTAKALVYNATWFALLQLYIVAVLINNMISYKMYKDVFSMKFIFHVAFIIIFLGAGVTRYFGYEGTLHIREGQTENKLLSAVSFIQMQVTEDGKMSAYEKEVLFSKLSSNTFSQTFTNGTHKVKLELLEYLPSATYELSTSDNGVPIFEMMVVGNGSPETITLKDGEYY